MERWREYQEKTKIFLAQIGYDLEDFEARSPDGDTHVLRALYLIAKGRRKAASQQQFEGLVELIRYDDPHLLEDPPWKK